MLEEKFDVIVVGSATRDVLVTAKGFEVRQHSDSPTGEEQCFPLGSKIELEDIVMTTGGGGTNVAVTFVRQGLKTACIGVIGNDVVGDEIVTELAGEGIDTNFFQKHSDDYTAYSMILVHPSGERTILSYKGEGQHFNAKKIPFNDLKAKWFFLDSLGGHYDLLESLVNHAVKNDIKIATNPGSRELAHGLEKLVPILIHADIFICNQEEGAQLVGVDFKDGDSVLSKLRERVKGMVLVTNGHAGVRARDTAGFEYSAGVPDSPVVERTGAGDAFGSGFVTEFIRSGLIEKAIKFGTANASSVVTKFGAKAGILKNGEWGEWPLVEVVKKKV